MKTKKDYEEALAVVQEVLREWDPYALLSGGALRSEFDAEAAKVVTHIPRISTPADAATALSAVFTEAFEAKGFAPRDCVEPGHRLFSRLAQIGLVHAQPGAQADALRAPLS